MSELAICQPEDRATVLASYRSIREAVLRVTGAATDACGRGDFQRAARQLGLFSGGAILLDEEDDSGDMIIDLAMFERNQRGRRAYDRFLAHCAPQLPAEDFAMARRMSDSFFSAFALAGRHETAGVWLLDRLNGDRRVWLMDESMERCATREGAEFGLRIFDAGPFHVGFGIVANVDQETIDMAIAARRNGDRMPFRHSLAAGFYREALASPLSPEVEDEMIEVLVRALSSRTAARVGSAGGVAKRGRR